jgi:hypothetical protein
LKTFLSRYLFNFGNCVICFLFVCCYTLNGFSDWFLPSKDELNELYLQKAVVGGFTIFAYWSSSEVDAIYAWAHIFDNGKQDSVDKAVPALGVRAVRAF